MRAAGVAGGEVLDHYVAQLISADPLADDAARGVDELMRHLPRLRTYGLRTSQSRTTRKSADANASENRGPRVPARMSQEKAVLRQARSTLTPRRPAGLPLTTTYSDQATATRRNAPPTTDAVLTIPTSGRPGAHVRRSSMLRLLLPAPRPLDMRPPHPTPPDRSRRSRRRKRPPTRRGRARSPRGVR